MALTPKQKMFIKEYLIDLNATQAAIRAGYSEKTAGAIGKENLQKPQIQEALEVEIKKRTSKVEITVENVLQDILDTRVKVDSAMADISDMKPSDIATLANAKAKQNDMLAKYLGMFIEKVEHSGTTGVTIVNDL